MKTIPDRLGNITGMDAISCLAHIQTLLAYVDKYRESKSRYRYISETHWKFVLCEI